MLLNDLSTGFVVLCGFVTIYLTFVTYYTVKLSNFCRDAVHVVMNQNKKAVTLRRMAEVEATLTDLTDAYEGLLKSHKKLRSRIGMRNVREERENAKVIEMQPDKASLRARAKSTGLL